MIMIKKNPFTTDPITNANAFLGRKEQIIKVTDCLYNFKPFLIKGERGVGKSSIANQAVHIARGEKTLLNKNEISLPPGEVFNYLTAIHRCTSSQNFIQLLKMIIRNMETQFLSSGLKTDSIKNKLTFDLKIFKYEVEAEIQKDIAAEAITEFTETLKQTWDAIKDHKNGILLIFDELDQVKSEIDMASFFKTCHENLRLDGYEKIILSAVGVNEVIYKLLEQHQSIDRFFMDIEIPLMSLEETKLLIITALETNGIKFDENCVKAVTALSKGYPAIVHLICYHWVRIDQDNYLDNHDLREALICVTREEKGDEYKRKLSDSGLKNERNILKAMATYGKVEVPNEHISKKLGVAANHYSANLGKLTRDGFISKTNHGTYIIKDLLFTIYLQLEAMLEEKDEEFKNLILKIEKNDGEL